MPIGLSLDDGEVADAVLRPDRSWLGIANSLAAGLMVGASAGLCY